MSWATWRHRLGLLAAVAVSLVFCWDHWRLPAPKQLEARSVEVEGPFWLSTRRGKETLMLKDVRDGAHSIDCASAGRLCEASATRHNGRIQARVIKFSSFGGCFAVSASVDGMSVTSSEDAAARFEGVRRGHRTSTLLVLLSIPLAIFLPGRR